MVAAKWTEGLRGRLSVRNRIVSASTTSSRLRNDSPMPSRYLIASIACRLPITPQSAPKTPVSPQLGRCRAAAARETGSDSTGRRRRDRKPPPAFEFEDAAVDQRPFRQEGGVRVQKTRREVVRSIHHEIVTRKQLHRVGGRHTAAMQSELDLRIERRQTARRRLDFGPTDHRGVVDNLSLQIVFLHLVVIRQAEHADARRGQ